MDRPPAANDNPEQPPAWKQALEERFRKIHEAMSVPPREQLESLLSVPPLKLEQLLEYAFHTIAPKRGGKHALSFAIFLISYSALAKEILREHLAALDAQQSREPPQEEKGSDSRLVAAAALFLEELYNIVPLFSSSSAFLAEIQPLHSTPPHQWKRIKEIQRRETAQYPLRWEEPAAPAPVTRRHIWEGDEERMSTVDTFEELLSLHGWADQIAELFDPQLFGARHGYNNDSPSKIPRALSKAPYSLLETLANDKLPASYRLLEQPAKTLTSLLAAAALLTPEMRQRFQTLPKEARELVSRVKEEGITHVWKEPTPQSRRCPGNEGVKINLEARVSWDDIPPLSAAEYFRNSRPLQEWLDERFWVGVLDAIQALFNTTSETLRLPKEFPPELLFLLRSWMFVRRNELVGVSALLALCPTLLKTKELKAALTAIEQPQPDPRLRTFAQIEGDTEQRHAASTFLEDALLGSYVVTTDLFFNLLRAYNESPHLQQTTNIWWLRAFEEKPLRIAHPRLFRNVGLAYKEARQRAEIARRHAPAENAEKIQSAQNEMETAKEAWARSEAQHMEALLAFFQNLGLATNIKGSEDERVEMLRPSAQTLLQARVERAQKALDLLKQIEELGQEVDKIVTVSSVSSAPEESSTPSDASAPQTPQGGFVYSLLLRGAVSPENGDPRAYVQGHTPYLSGPLTTIAGVLKEHVEALLPSSAENLSQQ